MKQCRYAIKIVSVVTSFDIASCIPTHVHSTFILFLKMSARQLVTVTVKKKRKLIKPTAKATNILVQSLVNASRNTTRNLLYDSRLETLRYVRQLLHHLMVG